jgi:haloalkane dehalogenase
VVEHFVDHLRLKDLTIMVQDWGGPIGFGLAERRPELVRRFIIGNTFARPLDGERRIRAFSALMGGPMGRALTWTFNFVPRFFFWRGFAKPLAPEVLAMYLAPWRERTRRILVDRRFSHSRRNTILSSQACFRTICKQTRRP